MLRYDVAIGPVVARLGAAAAALPPLAVGDVRGRRERIDAAYTFLSEAIGVPEDVDIESGSYQAKDGTRLPLRIYRPAGIRPEQGLVYLHGGGMICCSLDTHDSVCRRYAADTQTTIVAIEYRRAPEVTGTTPAEDCYAGLEWTHANASLLGLDPARVAVAGDSGGGGLAAAVALLARDRGGPPLSAQILIYPMLDDRNTVPDPALAPLATWTYDDNITGWRALLGDQQGEADVSPYASPARATDLTGLPPTYIDVGGLDIFRDECVTYAARLVKAGVEVEFHLHPGANHAFEIYAPAADVSQRAVRDRLRAVQRDRRIL